MAIRTNLFGNIKGNDVSEYTVSRGNLTVKILNFGGIVRSLKVKTLNGDKDIVLGYGTAEEYERDNDTYFGSIIGRVANRIAGGKFTLNGSEYRLFLNDKTNCLHGGKEGFNRKFWQADVVDEYSLRLSLLSADGEEGFPANLRVSVVYSLTERNGLKIEYLATADGDTPVSLTNHSYFNLNGEGNGDILGHTLTLCSDEITPVNRDFVPVGEFLPVAGTPFDFRTAKKIGKDIDAADAQLAICGGYDVNYVKNSVGYGLIAEAQGDKSGIKMSVYTTERGVQFYSGNFLNGVKGKTGEYGNRYGFCLETQGYPNAVNSKEYPSVILKAGEEYRSVTEYVIGV